MVIYLHTHGIVTIVRNHANPPPLPLSSPSSLSPSLTDSSQEQYFPDPSLDSTDPDLDDHRAQILNEALKLVSEHGWSGAVLSEAAKSLGLSVVMEEVEMFPRGPGNLVDHFEQQCNQRLNEIMEKLVNEDK